MPAPHDQLFWQVFSDPKHAVGELRALLPKSIEPLVAWDTLRRLPATYKDAEHGDQHADLLFGVQIGTEPALLYLLLEHKSTGDPWTAFQLLRYVVRILEQFRREHPRARKLPPILAMVVHHSARGWRRSTELLDLFELDDLTRPALAPFLPSLRFLLDDLSKATPETLASRTLTALARLTLLCLQRIREGRDIRTELRALRGAFEAALTATDTGEALSAVLSYIARVRDLPREELRILIRTELGPALEQTMTSTYDQLINEGREQGKSEGKADSLLKQLEKRFGELAPEVLARVQAANLEQLDRWLLRFVDARTLDEVFAED